MTVIVGIETNGHVIMGGDSAGVGGYDIQVRGDPKVFFVKNYVFGMCGSFRMGQILNHIFVPPKHPAKMDDYKFMVTKFIDAVRKAFKEGGFLGKEAEGQEKGGLFMVGYRGKLYRIDEDFQVGMMTDGYSAIGCGESYALGSLHSTSKAIAEDAALRVQLALEAAEYFSGGVSGPFHILALPPEEPKKRGRPRKS
jgi:20S proteasome alpha/beta subunit